MTESTRHQSGGPTLVPWRYWKEDRPLGLIADHRGMLHHGLHHGLSECAKMTRRLGLIPRNLTIRWMERLTLARLVPILLLEILLLLIVTILLLVILCVTTVATIATMLLLVALLRAV